MRRTWVAALLMLLGAVVGGCSSSSSRGAPATTQVLSDANARPSVSALMVCAREAVRDIAFSIGAKTVVPVRASWSNDLYACRFVYAHGAEMALSVKELRSEAATTAYYNDLAHKLGKVRDASIAGQRAFTTATHSFVVRKDDKVLLVDVSRLPPVFHLLSRGDVANDVAAVIMDCWFGL